MLIVAPLSRRCLRCCLADDREYLVGNELQCLLEAVELVADVEREMIKPSAVVLEHPVGDIGRVSDK
jgi:hypothetical protein